MVLIRRAVLAGALLLSMCGLTRGQEAPVAQAPNPGHHAAPSVSPLLFAEQPALEYQDRVPRGWISGGDPVGIPGEKGEVLDPRFYPPPDRWFSTLDVAVLTPHLKNQVNGTVTAGGAMDMVQLPTAPLNWTASPRVSLGYRFPNAGELVLSYESVVSSGTRSAPAAVQHSRLNLNVAAFDWASRENSLGPIWCMKWWGGVAYANAYFDTNATSPGLAQRTSESFNAAGPHAGLELCRALPAPGWSLFGRLEGMFLAGPADQSIAETVDMPGGPVGSGLTRIHTVPATPINLTVEGGISYAPANWGRWVRLTAAYHFEQWWALGFPTQSDANLTLQGVIFRAEITY